MSDPDRLREYVRLVAAHIAEMDAIAARMPLSIRIEVNNLQEVLDLLHHKVVTEFYLPINREAAQ